MDDFILLHVQGQPFWVRPSKVFAAGTGIQPAHMKQDEQGLPFQVPEATTTLISVEGLGQIPVDESVAEVLTALEG